MLSAIIDSFYNGFAAGAANGGKTTAYSLAKFYDPRKAAAFIEDGNSELMYVEVKSHQLYFHLINGEIITIYAALKDYSEKLLSQSHNIKPQKSFIVNLDMSGFLYCGRVSFLLFSEKICGCISSAADRKIQKNMRLFWSNAAFFLFV